MTDWQPDAGSFRDPGGAILEHDGRIFRLITKHSRADWEHFSASPLYGELQRERLLIPAWRAAPSNLPGVATDTLVVEHERVPFVSYPYEWSFTMLRDAALLHLELMERCLRHGFILKDATPYNVQFVGATPVFIDALSFTRLQEGEPWAGYNQFCRLLLYPLLLEAYKGVGFQAWLRSELEGIDPAVFARLFSWRDLLRPGVLTHVMLHAWLQKRAETARASVRGEIRRAGLSKDAIRHNVRRLRRLVERLKPNQTDSGWTVYEATHSYKESARRQKEEFVRRATVAVKPLLVWDLGANVGEFSRIAAESAGTVVAMDSDAATVDQMYCSLRVEHNGKILPLVVNVANPSPSQGWSGLERRSLPARGKPDLVLCLALAHHLRVSANVPVEALLAWLAGLQAALVIEFVSKDDAQTKRLLLNKDDTYDDYDRPFFERCLQRFFRIEETLELNGGTRVLYRAAGSRADVA